MRLSAQYWSDLKGLTDKERCEGMAFSMLNIIDGSNGAFRGRIDLIATMVDESGQEKPPIIINQDIRLHDNFFT